MSYAQRILEVAPAPATEAVEAGTKVQAAADPRHVKAVRALFAMLPKDVVPRLTPYKEGDLDGIAATYAAGDEVYFYHDELQALGKWSRQHPDCSLCMGTEGGKFRILFLFDL